MTTKVVDFDFGGEKGGRKEGRKFVELQCSAYLFILLLHSCLMQIIVAILLLYYHYNIVLKSSCPARVLLSSKSPECWHFECIQGAKLLI